MIINSKKYSKIILLALVILGLFSFGYFYNKTQRGSESSSNQALLTPLFGNNNEVVGEALINSNRDSGCFTANEVPKDNEYISYKYDGKCYINILYSQKALVTQNLLSKNYDSLYESRRYFDSEIKKLHEISKNMQFLWHPDQKKQEYLSSEKESSNGKIEESIVNVGKYKLVITSPWDHFLDDESFYTHVVITKNGELINTKDYKGVYLSHIYKIQVSQTFYYILGLCSGGMHGCGILVPIINDGDKLVIGKNIEDVDFSNYLKIEDFFTKNGELYTVFNDSRYFGGYSSSNNASYNSAVPRIYKFDKATGNTILETNNFLELYKDSVKIISDDLNKLKDSVPVEVRNLMMQTGAGRSLIPYFDYDLGMSILANKNNASQIRKQIEKLYIDFYGEKYSLEAHFDGYKDFDIFNLVEEVFNYVSAVVQTYIKEPAFVDSLKKL